MIIMGGKWYGKDGLVYAKAVLPGETIKPYFSVEFGNLRAKYYNATYNLNVTFYVFKLNEKSMMFLDHTFGYEGNFLGIWYSYSLLDDDFLNTISSEPYVLRAKYDVKWYQGKSEITAPIEVVPLLDWTADAWEKIDGYYYLRFKSLEYGITLLGGIVYDIAYTPNNVWVNIDYTDGNNVYDYYEAYSGIITYTNNQKILELTFEELPGMVCKIIETYEITPYDTYEQDWGVQIDFYD